MMTQKDLLMLNIRIFWKIYNIGAMNLLQRADFNDKNVEKFKLK